MLQTVNQNPTETINVYDNKYLSLQVLGRLRNREMIRILLALTAFGMMPFIDSFDNVLAQEKTLSYEEIDAQTSIFLNSKVEGSGQSYKDLIVSQEFLNQQNLFGNELISFNPRCEADCWFGIDISQDRSLYYAASISGKLLLLETIFRHKSIPSNLWTTSLEELRSIGRKGYNELVLAQQNKVDSSGVDGNAIFEKYRTKQNQIINMLIMDLDSYLYMQLSPESKMSYLKKAIGAGLRPSVSFGKAAKGSGRLFPLQFKLTPSTGTLSIITAYRFYLCKARGIDPYNLAKCPGWMLNPSQEIGNYLAGEYFFQAQWPKESRKKNGRVTIVPPQSSFTIQPD